MMWSLWSPCHPGMEMKMACPPLSQSRPLGIPHHTLLCSWAPAHHKFVPTPSLLSLTKSNRQQHFHFKEIGWASLVAQCRRTGLHVRSRGSIPIREDLTCRGATKPVRHSYQALCLQPRSRSCWAHQGRLANKDQVNKENNYRSW